MTTEPEGEQPETAEQTADESPEWKTHMYRVGPSKGEYDVDPSNNRAEFRKIIEPWLSAVFQSDYLSLLLGNGLTLGVASAIGAKASGMDDGMFNGEFGEKINAAAEAGAKTSERGEANFEDYLRVANELMRGLEILGDAKSESLKKAINDKLTTFIQSILSTETSLFDVFEKSSETYRLLVSFLLSFASRTASRERLNIFTTNYDRLIEYGCDRTGLHVIDRFVGKLTPIFRAGRLNIDMHYNPPGMRGEPRYLEGVVRLFKLHGSLDWRQEGTEIKRYGIPFGAPLSHPDIPKERIDSVMIYPNAAKDMETSEYPYAELFRDFSAAISRPNSVLVTYGYSFGDDHINRVIRDMLTIPSTHLVIISYANAGQRIETFCREAGHIDQITLLIGPHFGNLQVLVDNYLPKSAIDTISGRRTELMKNREGDQPAQVSDSTTPQTAAVEGGSNDVAN